MGFPLNGGSDGIQDYTFYQTVIGSELICMLAVFYSLQSIHYCLWGHEQEEWELKKNDNADAVIEPLPPSEWKWDQRSFNMYFALILGHHVSALLLPMAFYPSIVTCVLAYCHLGCFLGMLLNTILIDEKQPGQGGKTVTNRIFWIIMCILNLSLIGAGLTGVPTVLA